MNEQANGDNERLHELIAMQLDRQATDSELAELSAMLSDNEVRQQIYIEAIQDATSLRWWASDQNHDAAVLNGSMKLDFRDSLLRTGLRIATELDSEDLRGRQRAKESDVKGDLGLSLSRPRKEEPGRWRHALEMAIGRPSWSLLATIAAVLIVVGSQVYIGRMNRELASVKDKLQQIEAEQAEALATAPHEATKPLYSATLVSLTNCKWDKLRSTADFSGNGLQSGQSLHLLEGVAEVNSTLASGGVGRFQLEGPSAIMLSNEGIPTLLYGRLLGNFESDFDRFYLDTPLGRINVSRDASIGVVAAPNDLDLHVFAGAAEVDFWSPTLKVPAQPTKVSASESIRATVNPTGFLTVDRGEARESWFVNPTATAASKLKISEKYVERVRADKPLAYWRFETEADGVVRNEMADNLHCRMAGKSVRLHAGAGNRTIEFGFAPGAGYLMTDDVLDKELVGDSCTAEAWVKPAYCHHGVVFSMLDWLPDKSPYQRQFLHLELCGLASGFAPQANPLDRHAGQIRLLFRRIYWQCFSNAPYSVRQWQHLAAVKDRGDLRLYLNGKAVAQTKAKDAPMGANTRILMGQQYPISSQMPEFAPSRVFVGELDEVAFYNRALSDEDIRDHFEIVATDSAEAAEPLSDQIQ